MTKVIIGTGSDLPEWVLTNEDVAQMCSDFDSARAGGSLDDWSDAHVGVRTRHRVRPGEGAADMATRAARRALADAGLQPADLDLIVMATITSDHRMPGTAALLQRELDCRCKFFQLEHACTGFVDSVIVASALMDAYGYRTALVLDSDAGSTLLDPTRFIPATVFGDGAGAIILQERDAPGYGLRASFTEADGRLAEWTLVQNGGSKLPLTEQNIAERRHFLRVDFKNVYEFATHKFGEATCEVLRRAGATLDDIDLLVPHQAGRNVIEDAMAEMGLPMEKVALSVDHTGNTGGASIPITLDEAHRAGRLHDGDKIVFTAIGAGMAWASVYLVWYDAAAHAPRISESGER